MTPKAAIKELQRITAQIRPAHAAWQRRLSVDTAERLVSNSPVLTGQYRASHRIGVNEADQSYYQPRPPEPKRGEPPPIPAPPRGDFEASVSGHTFGDDLVHSNSVPHAVFIEFGTVNMDPRRVYEVTSLGLAQEAAAVAALPLATFLRGPTA